MNLLISLVVALQTAQPHGTPPEIREVTTRRIAMPYVVALDQRDRVSAIGLYVSVDEGKSWKRASEHKPSDREAIYWAERDGHHWFAVQVEWKDGRKEPAQFDDRSAQVKLYVNPDRLPMPQPAPKSAAQPATVRPALLRESLEKQGFAAIELEKLRSGYYVAPVKVGGRTLRLIVDTGAPNTYFDVDRSKSLGLEWAARPGADPAQMAPGNSICVVDSIEIGAIKTSRVVVGSIDESQSNTLLKIYGDAPLDGLLGTDVLEAHSAFIDLASRTLFLHPVARSKR
jgi:predicted aspartyl protease